MFYAIDQESFYEFTNFGAGTPSNQWTIPGEFGFNDDFTESYDLDKAKALMAEAGVDGFEPPCRRTARSTLQRSDRRLPRRDRHRPRSRRPRPATSPVRRRAASGSVDRPGARGAPERLLPRIAVTATQNPFDISSPEIDALMATITGDDAADEDIYEQMSMMVAGRQRDLDRHDQLHGRRGTPTGCRASSRGSGRGNVRLHGLSVTEG